MIIGIGCDIVSVRRIRSLVTCKNSKKFFLTDSELDLKSMESISGHFAAKEALLKALSIGFTRGLGRLTEIEVVNNSRGEPTVNVSGIMKEILDERNISSLKLTISHTTDYAIAFVILETD